MKNKAGLRAIFVLSFIVILFSFSAAATENVQGGTCGTDVSWTLSEDGLLTISGTGRINDYAKALWDSEDVSNIVVGEGITYIGEKVFSYLFDVESLVLPSTIQEIGTDAFMNTFVKNLHIKDIRSWCNIDFSNSSSNPMGENIYIDSVLTNNIIIPYGIETIKPMVFAGGNYESVIIPSTVKTIGDAAFSGSTLRQISIPYGVTEIGNSAFSCCYSLYNVQIANSVTTIGHNAFIECFSLKEIYIPEGIVVIGEDAFSGSGLENINVSENNLYYSSVDGVLFNKSKDELICYPSKKGTATYTVPDGVKTIKGSAFCFSTLKKIVLPDTVEEINEGAFSSCQNLQEITLPDGLTHIESVVFNNCTNLMKVTIPKSVERIGMFAFQSCYSLGNIFYEGSETAWYNIDIENYNDPLLTAKKHFDVGENTTTKEKNTNCKVVYVYANQSNRLTTVNKYTLCTDAIVFVGEEKHTCSDNAVGIVIPMPADDEVITIKKDGYVDKKLTGKQLKKNYCVYLHKDENEGPIINGVYIDNLDIYTKKYPIDLLDQTSKTITAEIVWKHENSTFENTNNKVYLLQDSAKVNFNGNALTTVISDHFDITKDVFIVAEDIYGNITKKKLNFEPFGTKADLLTKYNLNVGEKMSFKFPEGTPIAGMEMSLDLPAVPMTIEFEDNKFYVVIGVDLIGVDGKGNFLANDPEKTKISVKSLCGNLKDAVDTTAQSFHTNKLNEKLLDGLKEYKRPFGFDATVSLLGYMEGYIDSNNKIVVLDNALGYNVSIGANISHNFCLWPPLYWEFSAKGQIEQLFKVYVNERAKNFIPNTTFEGQITVGGGVGIGVAKAIGVTGGIQGNLTAGYELYDSRDPYFYLSGSIGGYVRAFIGPVDIYNEYWDWKKGTILEYPSVKPRLLSMQNSINGSLYDFNNYSLVGREYAQNESHFVANNKIKAFSLRPDHTAEKVIKTNIYTHSEVQLAKLPNGDLLCVWSDDDKSRTDINRTALYYSVCRDGIWSDYQQVNDDFTADYAPKLEIVGNDAYLIWENTKTILENEEDFTQAMLKWDICVSKFDENNNTFNTPIPLCNNDTIDYQPMICGEGSDIYAVWISNADNSLEDIFFTGDSNRIMYSKLSDGSWSTPAVFADNLTSITSMDATVFSGQLYVAYTLSDENSNEHIYLNNKDISTGTLNRNAVFDSFYLYWYCDGNVMEHSLYSESAVPVLREDDLLLTDRFDIVSNDSLEKAIVFKESEGLTSEIGAVIFDATAFEWGKKISLSDLNKNISGLSSVLTDEGDLLFLLTSQAVHDETDIINPYTETQLSLYTVKPACDLIIDKVYYDSSSLLTGNMFEIKVSIKNTGNRSTSGCTLNIISDESCVVASTNFGRTIIPNDVVDVYAYIHLTDALLTNCTVEVLPLHTDDIDASNNFYELIIKHEDVSVEDVGYGLTDDDNVIIYGSVVNRGYGGAENSVVSLRKSAIDGEIIQQYTINESLLFMDTAAFSFLIPAADNEAYFVTIDVEDMLNGNNSAFVVINNTDYVKVLDEYSQSLRIRKDVTENKITFTVETIGDVDIDLSELALYVAEYCDNGSMCSLKLGTNTVADNTVSIEVDTPTKKSYKIMLWDKNLCPIIDAITQY